MARLLVCPDEAYLIEVAPVDALDVASALVGCFVDDDVTSAQAWEVREVGVSIDDVDVELAASMFAGGFVVVGTAWVIGFGVRALLGMIRR